MSRGQRKSPVFVLLAPLRVLSPLSHAPAAPLLRLEVFHLSPLASGLAVSEQSPSRNNSQGLLCHSCLTSPRAHCCARALWVSTQLLGDRWAGSPALGSAQGPAHFPPAPLRPAPTLRPAHLWPAPWVLDQTSLRPERAQTAASWNQTSCSGTR